MRAWTGLIWLRMRTGGGLSWIWWWAFGFYKIRGISWVAQDMLASQEGLCCMELVFFLHLCSVLSSPINNYVIYVTSLLNYSLFCKILSTRSMSYWKNKMLTPSSLHRYAVLTQQPTTSVHKIDFLWSFNPSTDMIASTKWFHINTQLFFSN